MATNCALMNVCWAIYLSIHQKSVIGSEEKKLHVQTVSGSTYQDIVKT